MNPRTGAVYQQTRHWHARVAKLAGDADATNVAMLGGERVETTAKEPELPEAASELPVGRQAEGVAASASPQGWQLLQQWRRKQAVEDWKGADQVRMVVKMLLKDSVKETTAPDGKKSYSTTLKPHEVRQITQALSDVQRIQRLAIGLSTENVGIDQPAAAGDQQHVEKDVTPREEPIPVFVVEMSSRGKFLRPRPRRVK